MQGRKEVHRGEDSLPRRRFQGSSFFILPHKRLLNRKQHSFLIVLFAVLYFCKLHTFPHILRLFRFLFCGNRSGMDKSSSATCLLDSDVVKGDPGPTLLRKYQEEDKEEAVKRAIKESEIFVSQIFYNFLPLIFLSSTLLYHFFLYYCNLGYLPTRTTHYQRHLATFFFLQHNNIPEIFPAFTVFPF